MNKITYFAVFEPTNTGYSVFFPDFPGCITVGYDFKHTIEMAEEVLGLHIWELEKSGGTLPAPTMPPFEEEAEGIIVPVTVFPNLVKGSIENKAVKKTLTIPYWLNELAEEENVNFSNILQTALKEHLNVKQ